MKLSRHRENLKFLPGQIYKHHKKIVNMLLTSLDVAAASDVDAQASVSQYGLIDAGDAYTYNVSTKVPVQMEAVNRLESSDYTN
jgi:hypothetical protein